MLQKKYIRSLDCELYSKLTNEVKKMYFNAQTCSLNYKFTDRLELWTEVQTLTLILVSYALQLSLIQFLIRKSLASKSMRNYFMSKNVATLIY